MVVSNPNQGILDEVASAAFTVSLDTQGTAALGQVLHAAHVTVRDQSSGTVLHTLHVAVYAERGVTPSRSKELWPSAGLLSSGTPGGPLTPPDNSYLFHSIGTESRSSVLALTDTLTVV